MFKSEELQFPMVSNTLSKGLLFVSLLKYEAPFERAGREQSTKLFANRSTTFTSNSDPEKQMIFTSSPFIGPPVGKQVDITSRIHLVEEPKWAPSACLILPTLSFMAFRSSSRGLHQSVCQLVRFEDSRMLSGLALAD